MPRRPALTKAATSPTANVPKKPAASKKSAAADAEWTRQMTQLMRKVWYLGIEVEAGGETGPKVTEGMRRARAWNQASTIERFGQKLPRQR
eukprot:4436605-Amphidinium_carterae.1